MEQFGTSAEQVRRDHVISQILAVLSERHADELIFFGGTALSRTHLRFARLSEDVDLIATGDRKATAARIVTSIENALRRNVGRISWRPAFNPNNDVEAAIAYLPDRTTIKVQLLAAGGYEVWPTELRGIEQRYADAPPATLYVPTRDSFVGWKTATWIERAASRDLYDLWALGLDGYSEEAVRLFHKHGPAGGRPRPWMFRKTPPLSDWISQLSEQTTLTVGPDEAMAVVRTAWSQALGEDWDEPADDD